MLVCPTCQKPGLKITERMKLRADMFWDERAIQALECPACEARFWGEYLEERRGRRDRVSHSATPISPQLFADLSTALAANDTDQVDCLIAREPGDSAHLRYEASDGSAALSRATAPQYPSSEPAQIKAGWLGRLGNWLKN